MLDAVNPVNNWVSFVVQLQQPFSLFSPRLESKHSAHSCLWEEAWHVICGPEKGKVEDILKFNPNAPAGSDLRSLAGAGCHCVIRPDLGC